MATKGSRSKRKLSLAEFCERYSQLEAAAVLDCSQSNVSLMLTRERDVWFVPARNGKWTFYELKKPRKRHKAREIQ